MIAKPNAIPAEKLANLQARANSAKEQKAAAKREMELLEQDYEKKVAEAKAAGVDNVDDLPSVIEELTKEYQTLYAVAEKQVVAVEKVFKGTP